jgi:hypothetical protein
MNSNSQRYTFSLGVGQLFGLFQDKQAAIEAITAAST